MTIYKKIFFYFLTKETIFISCAHSNQLMELKMRVILSIFLLFCVVYSETLLPDTISDIELTAVGSPYVAGNTIVIKGRVTVDKGCVFLFHQFCGLLVEGDFIVRGSRDSMVLFTTANNKEYNPGSEILPNPFDWNGILVSGSGCVEMRNFILEYSVYGIRSSREDILIENGIFRSNGQYHFSIEGRLFPVVDKLSFSYNVGGEKGRCFGVVVGGDERGGIRKLLGIGIGVSGLVVAGVGLYLFRESGVHYDMHKASRSKVESDREYGLARGYLLGGIISSAVGAGGIGGGIVVYFGGGSSKRRRE